MFTLSRFEQYFTNVAISLITYISYFVAGGYNDFYRELNEQDYDVMLDDTPRGNTTFF